MDKLLSALIILTCLSTPLFGQNAKTGYRVSSYWPNLLANPAGITFDGLGRPYLLSVSGELYRGDDVDNDGDIDVSILVYNGDTDPNHLFPFTGITWHNGEFFISSKGIVSRLSDTTNDGLLDTHVDIVTNLPFANHQNNTIVFDENDQMYFSVGSVLDHGPEPSTQSATIMTCDKFGNNLAIHASGLRNAFGLAYKQGFGLVAVDNGPNLLLSNLHPPDELNFIESGKDYGHPGHFGIPPTGSGTQGPAILFAPPLRALCYRFQRRQLQRLGRGCLRTLPGQSTRSSRPLRPSSRCQQRSHRIYRALCLGVHESD